MKRLILIILLLCIWRISFSQCTPYQVFVTGMDVSCNGYNDGSIFIDSVGGTPPYQYFWQGPSSFNSNNGNISSLFPGTYQLTVVDSNNCQSISTIVVINEPNFNINLNSTNISCNGHNDGSISVNINGGISPFNYNWNPANTNSSTINSLPIGTFNVIVTDANGCVKNDSVELTQPDSLLIALDFSIDVSCNGASDGDIKISPIGGAPPYQYFWVGPNNYVNPNNTMRISFLFAGTYTVTITDQNNCQNSLNVNISEPPALSLSSTIQNISCFGNQDGNININANGGTPPYSYLWNNGDTLTFIDSLFQGNYSVEITDNNNCQFQQQFQITQPNPLSAASLVSSVSCNGDNSGAINLTTTGGTSPYFYNWVNGATTEDISSLNTGNYTVIIADANSCIITDSFFVLEPPPLVFSVDSISDVNCFGQNNGFVQVSSVGGTLPYSYSWSDTTLNDSMRNNLFSGTYTSYLQDNNGCTDSLLLTINQAAEILINASIFPHLCNNDSSAGILINTTSGGIGSLSFNWTNGTTNTQLNNLFEDSLSVVVSDSVNCSKQFDFLLPQPQQISINFNASSVSCNGFSDGMITTIVSGGVGMYQYLWSTNDTTPVISNLVQGSYLLSITDSNNCFFSDSVIVSSPSVLLSVFSTNNSVSCNGIADGVLGINTTGGTPPYLYDWSNGSSGNMQDSLVAGNYIVTTTDAENCITTNSANITEPNQISTLVQTIDVACYGGSNGEIQLGISGGTPPFTHNWSNGDSAEDIIVSAGVYIDSITDNNGCKTIVVDSVSQPQIINVLPQITNVSCFGNNDGDINLVVNGGVSPFTFNWASGQTTNNIDSLIAGMYIVQLTDFNNCSVLDTFELTEPFSAISLSSILTNTSCYGSSDGEINISVIGGLAPYQYLWSNNSITEDISNLLAGNYSVTISDSNGCTEIQSFVISQPDSIDVIVSTNNVSCNGGNDGAATTNVNGGYSPYQYNWSNGGVLNQTTTLVSGNHSVIVTDSNNCSKSTSFIIYEPTILSVSISTSNISCFAANDGVLTAAVSGGTTPYTVSWSNGENSLTADSLIDGLYSVNILDSNGCSVVGFGIIQEPDELLYSSVVTDVKCFAGNDGMIDLSVSGGSPPLSFLWSNLSTVQDLNSVPAGSYSVIVTDNNNCQIIITDTINEPTAPISISSIIKDVDCFGANNGMIDLTINGGISPYTFIWSNGFNSEDISSLSPSYYSVVVLDANNCSENYAETIGSVAEIAITPTIKDESCPGSNDGEITIQISGGISPYSIFWINGDTTNQLSNLSANLYNVSISDSVNCSSTKNIEVKAGQSILLNSQIQDLKCFGDSSGSISINILGGVSPYDIMWDDGDTSIFRTGLLKGQYTVYVTDSAGCESEVVFNIDQPQPLDISIYGDNASCTGINDGNVYTDVSGGTSPYFYLWNNGTNAVDLLSVIPATYNVEITDSNLCKIKASFQVLIDEDCVNISTAFTPNNDGVNDFWVIKNIENFQNVQVSIFDANGFVYFSSSNYDNSWDGQYRGKNIKSGTYYFYVKIETETFTGSITIVR